MSEFINQIGNYLASASYLYWVLALVGSGIFCIQFILSLFGFGDGDMDVDGDGSIEFGEHVDHGMGDFRLFSFRAIVAFIMFFGWGGVLWGHHGWLGFFAAFLCGVFMMVVTAVILFMMLKMQHEGTVTPSDLVGCNGTVYLRIPADQRGKVTVDVKGCTREIDAVADGELLKGTPVEVVKHIEGQLFKVKKIK